MFLSTLLASAIAMGSVNLEPCYVNGAERALACTMLSVPKHHDQKAGSTVTIHVIKANAQARENSSPLFVLAGGPGQAATEMTHLLNSAFKEVKKRHDIVFVAQRGSGLSNGQHCDAHNASNNDALQAAFEQCRPQVMAMEKQLSTDTLAKDIEATRIALGYDKISLWGGSYGTYAAQHYASLYPAQVDSLILDAAVALNANPLVIGSQFPQQSLDRLDDICQQDKDCATLFPRWKQHLYQLLSQLEDTPMELSVDGESIELDRTTMAHIVRASLYSPSVAAKLPLAIETAMTGDTRLLGALNGIIAGATTNTMYVGLTMGVLCQEHVYQGQGDIARAVSQGSFTQDSYYTFWADACGTERSEQADYINVPEALPMPALVISGSLDPITPEQSGDLAMAYLPNAQHIVIPNAGHTNSGRGCMPHLLNEFLLHGEVADTRCITNNQFPAFLK